LARASSRQISELIALYRVKHEEDVKEETIRELDAQRRQRLGR